MTLSAKVVEIRRMFSDIATSYDLLNHLRSLQIDQRWRRRAVRQSLRPTDTHVLDLCCGSGDFSLAYAKMMQPGTLVVGSDFAHPMLTRFNHKLANGRRSTPTPLTIEADSLRVPFADGLFDVVSVAFGLRNLDGTQGGIIEMARLLRPGGRAVILEFCPPAKPNVFHRMFSLYFRHILPRIGRVVSRHPTAYSYLPRSVEGFPPREEIVEMLDHAGLTLRTAKDLTGGIATLFVAEKVDSVTR
jgi:demethylmenaquinone methyltransferase/2-methoxy-6-polyprenyl-1,4-benzoquinol methylase